MAHERNFTQGSIPAHLGVLFGPLMAASVFQQLYAIADALLIGYLVGTDAFAAVGVAQTLSNLLVFLMIGLTSGPAVYVGHLLGAQRAAAARVALGSALSAGLVVSAAVGVGSAVGAVPVLQLLATPTVMMDAAAVYAWWAAASLPVVYAGNLFAGMLRATGNAAVPFASLTVAAVRNVALDGLFMGGLGWGVAGAAAATVTAQATTVLWCGACLQRCGSRLRLGRGDLAPRRAHLIPMARLSSAASVQAASLYIGKILVQGVVNGLGSEAIIAYAAAMRIEGLAQAAGEAGQNAGIAVIAQNHGAGCKERTSSAFRWLMAAMTGVAALIGAGMFVFAEPLLALFSAGDQGAVAAGLPYLRIIAAAYFLCLGGNAWVARFQGTGRFGLPLLGTTVQIYARLVFSLWWAPTLGLAGIAWATVAGWVLFHLVFAVGLRKQEGQEGPFCREPRIS
ncbi:MAG: MATE family efflux transporter [Adlercreutzia sp.]|nr:MATE family efflux transporter [Adlercreutzia sp.]